MGSSATDLVVEGRAALAAGDVAGARAAYERAAELAECGDVLDGLAEVTYREVDFAAASALYGRAFAAYQREDRPLDAARVARTLAYQYALHGDDVLMAGWVERARSLVPDHEGHVERLWVELFDALGDPDLTSRERRLRALTLADTRDRNLDCDARALLGKLCVDTGRLAEGMALLDETRVEMACLDYNLRGETSSPVAQRLRENGVDFVLATGLSHEAAADEEMPDVPILAKPIQPARVLQALAA